MADTVTLDTVHNTPQYVVRKIMIESDGTGTADQVLFDLSALNSAASYLKIVEVNYSISGFNYVRVYWDRTSSDEDVLLLKGQGAISYEDTGPLVEADTTAAGTGDIVVDTDGGADGSMAEITILCKYGYVNMNH